MAGRRRRLTLFATLAALVGALAVAPTASAAPFPDELALPNGFAPEGIAIGPGPVAYFGSLQDGSVYAANLLTGRGRVISEGSGTPSVGMKTDGRGRLFIAGGPAGNARVVDTRTGRALASYTLATSENTFVNDVVLAGGAAWFTDSFSPVLYRLPLPGGALPDQSDVQRIPLTGDVTYQDGFNLNGIETTPDGSALLAVQSNTGKLFRIAPTTGRAREVPVTGGAVPDGDGLLRDGKKLYVIQSGMTNAASLLRVTSNASAATVTECIADPRMTGESPTTAALFAGRVYIPLARFAVEPTPTTEYKAITIPRR